MPKQRLLLALAGLLAAAALGVRADDDKAGPKDNMPPTGYTALFNGKDLAGWKGLIPINKRDALKGEELTREQEQANRKVLPHWKVEDGILVYDGQGDNLQTAKDYGNFDLYIDWKIAEGGDSGIYLRGNPQVQIWDSDRAEGAKGLDKGSGSGGLWNNQKNPNRPLKKADKPVGEWNNFHIIMKGDRVTVFLNGQKVVENTPLENYWDPAQPLPSKGPIELQHHDHKLWFKNIYIKELN